MISRRQLCASAATLALMSRPVRAQAWPSKPVRVFVGFAAGGNSDLVARLIGARLAERLGQPFVIENRAGANGTLAAEATARAAPDGYTLFMASLPHIAIAPAVGKLAYDPVRDFAAISNVGTNPFVLCVHPRLPAKTLAEFEAQVRREPGKIAYASGGTASLTHLSMALYLKRAGLDMIHVPYKGGGPATTDFLAGHVMAYFSNLSGISQHAQAGTVRALAISDDKRHPQLPDVPTMIELGYAGFRTLTWNGLVAPTGTPKDIIDKLARETAAIVREPAVIERLQSYGVDPLGDRPDEFAATIAADIALWAEAVKVAGVAAP